ncbi:hypothetical protein NCDO763_0006 [Lactococcus cremoris]|nr:hypothetical protein N41_1989 [Lactococcus cremoris]KZK53651.1 hypothetical protein NCDO763_0006 [Lactococcus cremoris]MBS5601184.1 hypothetical protein [Lactococcus lactis]
MSIESANKRFVSLLTKLSVIKKVDLLLMEISISISLVNKNFVSLLKK